jgi:threonine/homoserine/homoserine lactone efflux protein
VLIPGTCVVYTISTGLTLGKRASTIAALGCTAGIVPHLAATILGLSAVMHTSALAFQVLKYAGVAYLFYLAAMTWRDKTAFCSRQDAAARDGEQPRHQSVIPQHLEPEAHALLSGLLAAVHHS